MAFDNGSGSKSSTVNHKIRVLELYSGIGGMRYALEASGINFEVVAAMDINPVVNIIYNHNFGLKEDSNRNLLSFTVSEMAKLDIDMITMSPPCQPFTRVGLKKDVDDQRTCSFLHMLKILNELHKKPLYIILENVKGFEESQSKFLLVETLNKCGYSYQEFLLSPRDFGMPNSRLRYYLIAKLGTLKLPYACNKEIISEIPDQSTLWSKICPKCNADKKSEEFRECSVRHFLEDQTAEYFEQYLIPDNVLLKYWTVFDIVNENSKTSCCFTKAYQHYSQGTGSIFLSDSIVNASNIMDAASKCSNDMEKLLMLKQLNLRYFTPREIANLMGFPVSFKFPLTTTIRQMYKSLGNSLNIFVVTYLFNLLRLNS